ncbi:tetratricopeptide repeat protein [Hyphobacterium sp. CCMP332]|uniref:tetratricopeptide repeat protein n=1 Tax=Hyphobacterium sp. CCMP332 TaxID=2749086 RepID=UPI00164FBB12|nr:tetratricopeptide repeat protein [Hyphobacterium sp. CCMP332]QNL18520.1 tetratricopeptide repeat protein [Hyphobacterium sp. CCMP332]
MADIFHEVEEELRKDKYNDLLRKWGPLALGGAFAIVVTAAAWQGWDYWQTQRSHAMSDRYFAALELVEDERLTEADLALQQISEDSASGYAALALMQRGELALQGGDAATAGYFFEQAADRFSTVAFSDLAHVKAAMAQFEELSIDDLQNRLGDMMQPERPYRLLAMEVIAAKAFAEGDLDRAHTEYSAIAGDIDGLALPVSQRAQAAVDLIERLQQQAALDSPVTDDAMTMPALPDTPDVDPATFDLGDVLDRVDEETGTLTTDSPQLPDATSLLDTNDNDSAEDGQD